MMIKKYFLITLAAALILTGCTKENDVSSDSSTSDISTAESSTSSEQNSSEYVPGERDENGGYVVDGYAAKLEYPLNEKNINYAAKRFAYIYEQFLKEKVNNIFVTGVPVATHYQLNER